MPKIERIKTGINGLDKLIDGGFVKGNSVLVTGSAGTGKTIFCCQFLWEGLKNGENCMYITFEELPEEIKGDAAVFGWDFDKYEKEGKLIISYRDPFQTTDITTRLQNEIKQSEVTRVVVDSTSLLGLYFKDAHDIRRELYKLVKAIKATGATAILTAEIPQEDRALSRFGVEEYVVDGVIVLNFVPIGTQSGRNMLVRKMRRTSHTEDIHPIKIDKNGINILNL